MTGIAGLNAIQLQADRALRKQNARDAVRKLVDMAIQVCSELWIIGPRREISEGMRVEISHARSLGLTIFDLRGEHATPS